MRYIEFRDSIQAKLQTEPEGLTWKELRKSLHLPYKQPCPEWTKQLEAEIGLDRSQRKGNELIWRSRQKRRTK